MISYELIKLVSEGLGDLLNEVVFVGGAFVNLYSTDAAAPEPRPTDDIDCVVETVHLSDYNRFENKLRSIGFKNDTGANAPMCRYIYKGVKVDFIPTKENILGFQNKWYPDGFKYAVNYEYPGGINIKIFPPVYFLASKLDAFRDRGRKDIRLSSDFEDVVYILDSRKEIINEILNSEDSVRNYIIDMFKYLLRHPDLTEGLVCALPPGSGETRVNRLKSIITNITNS
ncbi:MAG: hypothetical protein MUE56_07710 [Ignavibacteria bacterium]|jgi:predicted nucleotidyltransferase|nr:hypothetical protein [Ignavibacteria bacterium]